MKNDPFPLGAYERLNESDDPVFYSEARKLVHIDEGAVEALRSFYSEVLPEDGKTLDLMSSWRSHLPGLFKYLLSEIARKNGGKVEARSWLPVGLRRDTYFGISLTSQEE